MLFRVRVELIVLFVLAIEAAFKGEQNEDENDEDIEEEYGHINL